MRDSDKICLDNKLFITLPISLRAAYHVRPLVAYILYYGYGYGYGYNIIFTCFGRMAHLYWFVEKSSNALGQGHVRGERRYTSMIHMMVFFIFS